MQAHPSAAGPARRWKFAAAPSEGRLKEGTMYSECVPLYIDQADADLPKVGHAL